MAQIESLTTDAIIALVNAGTWPQDYDVVTGNLTTIGDQVAVDVSEANGVTFSLKNTGAVNMAVGTFVFEASNDSTNGTDGTWVAVLGLRTSANTAETQAAITALASGAVNVYGWKVSVPGYKWFRIRSTVAPTATSIATFTVQRSPYVAEVTPFIPTHAVTGSGTFTVQQVPGTDTSVITAGSTIHATAVKGASGNLFEISIFNGTGVTVYVKLWNKASAPAPASDAALLRAVIPVAAGAVWNQEFGNVGKRFSTGIGLAITTAAAATDVAVPAAGVNVSLTYI